VEDFIPDMCSDHFWL